MAYTAFQEVAGDLAAGDLADRYQRDGFLCPIDVMSPEDASAICRDLEAAEAALADDAERLALLRSYPNHLLPSFDWLVRHEAILSAVRTVLGPDLLCWSAGLFIKEPETPHIVSWHQDLTYWGLDDAEEVTAWFALTPAPVESGCMMFVPGSHKRRAVPHRDTFAEDNLLTRGQEITVEVKEGEGVPAPLLAGQCSLHHGHIFHASGPNRTPHRRIGAAIRYIKPSMRQEEGDRTLVALVAGEDRFGHFTVAEPPRGRLAEADFALCRRDTEMKRRILYRGVDGAAGKRY